MRVAPSLEQQYENESLRRTSLHTFLGQILIQTPRWMTMPTLGYNGMETTDPNAICAAFLELESRNSRDLMDCEVVRVLDTSYAREEGRWLNGLC